MKRTICWVTSGYLLQVDLPILKHLKEEFNIKWIVYAKMESDMAQHATDYAHENGLELILLTTRNHRFSPLIYFEFTKQMKMIRDLNANIYYFDTIAFPYLIFAIKKYIPANKIVMAMHHGYAPTLIEFRPLYKKYLRFLCKQNYTFQYFSETQASYFTGNQSKKYVINLSLNDYGKSQNVPPTDYVSFLFFGVIIGTKNVDGIIEAACMVKEKTNKKFKIKIVGHCRDWEPYKTLIKYPEIFDLKIERVPDTIIPDLFSSAHYLLQPYKFVSQSGPLRMAYGYNLPVITSNLDGFKESVVENVTGIFCRVNDTESLANVMLEVIENHPTMYNELKNKQVDYIHKNMSQEVIISRYIEMFKTIR